MSDFILRARHWQVFVLMLPLMVAMSLTIQGAPLLAGVISAVGYFLYFTWFAFLGSALFPLLPRAADYSLTWFLLDIALVSLAFSALMILTDNRSFHGEGLVAMPMFYTLFAMLHAPWFLAVSLVAIEKQRPPEFGFYFGTLLLFLFWPIGVWFVQPRLNKVWEESRTQQAEQQAD